MESRLNSFVYRPLLIALLAWALSGRPIFASDWPQWRGPNHDGISTESGWLDHWPQAGPTIAWKNNVGTGFSTCSVVGNRVYTAGNTDNTDTIFCLDADSGKVVWRHSYPSELGDRFFEGGTTGTPTVDGDRVFFLGRWGDVFCLNAASGAVVWSENVHQETGAQVPGWGFGSSPLVFNNLLILNVGDAGTALDKNSGKVIWHSGMGEAGYSTPLPVQLNGHWLALFSSGKAYLAIDPQSGQELWSVRWLTQYGVNAADPIVDGNGALISSGYGKGAALLKINVAPAKVLWKSQALHTQLSPAVRWELMSTAWMAMPLPRARSSASNLQPANRSGSSRASGRAGSPLPMAG